MVRYLREAKPTCGSQHPCLDGLATAAGGVPVLSQRSNALLTLSSNAVETFAPKSPWKDNGRLFHEQIILYGVDPLDAPGDLTRFIDGLLRIHEAAQLHDALVGFHTDLK
jgi:hypothetical protein